MSENLLPVGLSTVLTDKLRPETEESEQLFALLLDSAPDALVVVDDQGKILLVNSQAEKMFGYTRKQLLNEPIEKLVPSRHGEMHRKDRADYNLEPQLREMGTGRELFARRFDDSEFPVEISLSPLQTTGGLYVSSVIRDHHKAA